MRRAVRFAALLALAALEAAAQETAREPVTGPQAGVARADPSAPAPEEIVVTGYPPQELSVATTLDDERGLASRRALVADSARLLQDVPGVTLNAAGGLSTLPAIHGLSDDRVRVQVDGMDVTSACPNHMNSPLSYISPKRVRTAIVVAGITPVSVGGNSLGGTIQVESSPPEFAADAGEVLAIGRAGAFYRSNGEGSGYDFGGVVAGRSVSLSYEESSARSHNYRAGGSFRPAGPAAPGGGWLDGDEVGSSAYDDATNRDVELALRRGDHLLRIGFGRQRIGFEGFANQRMDMTFNENDLVNVRYEGRFEWGELDVRGFSQDTRHEMDLGADRFSYGFGMPMSSRLKNHGVQAQLRFDLGDRHLLRVGTDYLRQRLDDWWSPVGAAGTMCCQSFWNVRDGEQDRAGAYAEWEARWSPDWMTLVGARADFVTSDAGRVQGYNDTMLMWTVDAAAFNARHRRREDVHGDVAVLIRGKPDPLVTVEAGYARKTRSPNLYERYTWSTNSMAAVMNNLVGDGNGYVGDVGLEPETANTVSATLALHDAAERHWGVKATTYLTQVEDYIDARRCDFGQCSSGNLTAPQAFVFLQYVNQPARLYGVDLDATWKIGTFAPVGSFTLSGLLGYVRGENRATNDGLYDIMPVQGMLALAHERGGWSNRIELRGVGEKRRLSRVRNELETASHALIDLRSSWQGKHLRLDVSLENVLDQAYDLPLGGAYVGQGLTMSPYTTPWGIAVPGPGRSVNVAVSAAFRGGGPLPSLFARRPRVAPASARHELPAAPRP
jgi:iron complex outermembrane receptor protein